jgi:hypothetical protein
LLCGYLLKYLMWELNSINEGVAEVNKDMSDRLGWFCFADDRGESQDNRNKLPSLKFV